MAVNVGIRFVAEAGNVPSITQQVRTQIGGLSNLPPIVPKVDTGRLQDDLRSALAPSNFRLPPLQIPPPEGASEAKAALDEIRNSLDAMLTFPGWDGQARGYAGVVSELQNWERENQKILGSNQLLQSQFKTLMESAQTGLIEERSRSLADFAQGLASAAAGVGSFFSQIAVQSATVAGNFEQLEAKLTSVTGDLATARSKFEFAANLAPTTPFDVKSLVDSTAVLEGYKQKAEDLLPVAANLAAAMGKSLPEATLVLAKAASGGAEGWESLRNEYAITTGELLKFGAAEGKVAGQLSHLESDIERNRNALVKVINTRFGDAIERQSRTLQGAMSNVGDSAQLVTAEFGRGLIPITTLGARSLSNLISAANLVPAPFKAIAIAGVAVVGGLATILAGCVAAAGAALLLQANLAMMVRQLRVLKVEAPLASGALQLLSGGMTRVSGAMTAARLSSAAFLTGVTALAAIVATVGLAAIDSMQRQAEVLGDAVSQASRRSAESGRFVRQGIGALNQAGKEAGVVVKIVGDAGQQIAQINAAFDRMSPMAAVRGLQQIGQTADTLKAQLKNAEEGAAALKPKLDALIAAREAYAEGELVNPGAGTALLQTSAIQDPLKAVGLDIRNYEQLEDAIRAATSEYGRFGVARTQATRGLEAFSKALGPIQQAVTDSKQLGEFLDLSKQVGSAQALATALAEVERQLAANAKLPEVGSLNPDALLARLSSPEMNKPERADERNAILATLNLLQQKDGLLKQVADNADAAAKKEAAAIELAFRRRKALGETNLHDELYFIEQRLRAAETGSEEEVRLLEEATSTKAEIQSKLSSQAEQSLRAELARARQSVDDARASGANVLSALEAARRQVEIWASANRDRLKMFPDLEAELEKFRSSNAIDQQKQKAQQLKDNLQQVLQPLRQSLAEATTNEQKLAIVTAGIVDLQRRKRAGLVEEIGAQNQINDLTKQKHTLEKQITAEKQRQKLQELSDDIQTRLAETTNAPSQLPIVDSGIAKIRQSIADGDTLEQDGIKKITDLEKKRLEILKQIAAQKEQQTQQIGNLELSNLQAELQVLEARRDAGESVEKQITANRAAQTQIRLQLIEEERQAAIKSSGDAEFAERQAVLKKQALRTQDRLQAIQEKQKLDSALNKVGGPNSPLSTDPTAGLGIRLGNFVFNELKKPSLPGPKIPNFGLPPIPGKDGGTKDSSPQQGVASSETTNNYYITVNGGSNQTSEEFKRSVLVIVREAIGAARNRTGSG